MLSPQNVKNNVTYLPMEAAAFAMMNAAMVLSRSPLNSTKVLPLGRTPGAVFAGCFSTVAFISLTSFARLTSLLPVRSHHTAISEENAASSETISTR